MILASAKKTFFAGAELKDVLKFGPNDGPQVFEWIQGDEEAHARAGEARQAGGGGGRAAPRSAAVARSRSRRTAASCLDDPRIQLGLPEVTLGLLPGAGGVTKMVRLLGLQAAFPYLIEGKTLRPQEAAKLGLIQGLAANDEDLFRMAREWIRANPSPVQPWDDEKYRMPGGSPSSPQISQMLAIAPAMLTEKTRGLLPAPEAIMSCAVEGAYVDFDTALRIESRYLAKLAVGQVAKNLITLFFNRTAIKSGASVEGLRAADAPRWKAQKVGILGAGMMGAGIAWANATRGVPCVLKDVSTEKAQAGQGLQREALERRVKQGRATQTEAEKTLSLIQPTENVKDLAGCDLIIEAVFEKRDLKAQVTKEAEPMLAANGIFASNTSTLPISGLAQASRKPENFIGLHFFSPVDKMQLVEIIKGEKTSPDTLARAYDYVLQIGKTPIVVNDARGFYTSRTFGTFVQEGCAMLAEGIPAARDRERGALRRHAGRAAGRDRRDLDVAVGACHGADRRRPESRRQATAAGASGAGSDPAHGEGDRAARPRRGRRFLRVSERRKEIPLAGAREGLRQAGRLVRHRGAEGADPLSPVDRDRALPGGGRAHHGARRATSARSSASASRPGPAARCST